MSDETSRNREADRRSSGPSSPSSGSTGVSERDGHDGVGASSREQRLKDDEGESGEVEAEELPKAYRHELPNLRD